MPASADVIGFLHRNQKERDELVDQLRKNADIRDGMTYLKNAATLSPKSTRIYTQLLSLESLFRQADKLRELKQRILAANVDTGAQEKQFLDVLHKKDLKKRLAQYEKAIESRRAAVENTKSKKNVTFAIARATLASHLIGLWMMGGTADVDEIVKLAEAAHQAAPSSRTSGTLMSAYAFRALLLMAEKNKQVREFSEKYRMILIPVTTVTLLLARNDEISKALKSDPDVVAVMGLVRDRMQAFPDDVDINDWALLRSVDPATAESLAERVRKNDRFRLWHEISGLLNPTSSSSALSLYWLKSLDGHDVEAKQVLEKLKKYSIELPVGK